MSSHTSLLRWAVRGGTIGLTAALAAAGLSGIAVAKVGPGGGRAGAAVNPYSPALRHAYRHGVLPTLARQRQMSRWASVHASALPSARSSSSFSLSYGGGLHGKGVTSGKEKVYLVFWGSQWGTQGTGAHGTVTLSGDPGGEAPYLQQMLAGLGTGGERWSGVMTQYCDGVAYNAQSCPANSWHVAYPAGGALAGVWVDEQVPSPGSATGHQLGTEAIAAAAHFGNTTNASNRDAQYVIASPTGTHPDGFNTPGGQFCAWHDDTADPNLPAGPVSSSLDVAFTNLPYVVDMGASCGENFVNPGSAGVLDGVSIVEGHEYAETVTDQFPAFGWTSLATGEENGDLCAWNPPGPGGTNDLTLPTGTFAMQSTFANDLGHGQGGCEFSHPVVANNWVLNGGFDTGTLAHWTTSGVTSVVSSGARSGKYAARAGKPAPTKGNSAIAQTFVARGVHLSFWYNVTCPDKVSQSWATATLTDNTTHATRTVLARTCLAHSGWRQVTASVVAGHSYTLRLTSHDDHDTAAGDGTFTLFDSVTDN